MTISSATFKREVKRLIGISIGCLGYIAIATSIQAYSGEANQTQLVSPLPETVRSITTLMQKEPVESSVIEPKNDGCELSDTFTPEVQRWAEHVCRWGQEHQMDPNLIATIMQIESCGNHHAVSATGVRGLFQVTGANLDGEDPFDPNVSMAKGPGKVLKSELTAAKENVIAAFAGYNGGGKAREYIQGDISYYQFYWFLRNHSSGYWWSDASARAKINEVEYYAQWANIFLESKNNDQTTLNRWLEAGGQRLCDSAATITLDDIPQNKTVALR